MKAKEYLESGCQEVWLVFPESLWVIVLTEAKHFLRSTGEEIETQTLLPGFRRSPSCLLEEPT